MPRRSYSRGEKEGILGILLVIVIGLGLVSTVATSTSTASTALAPFAGAQSLVILVPLIFVAIILLRAYSGARTRAGGALAYEEKVSLWARFRVWVASVKFLSQAAKLQARR